MPANPSKSRATRGSSLSKLYAAPRPPNGQLVFADCLDHSGHPASRPPHSVLFLFSPSKKKAKKTDKNENQEKEEDETRVHEKEKEEEEKIVVC